MGGQLSRSSGAKAGQAAKRATDATLPAGEEEFMETLQTESTMSKLSGYIVLIYVACGVAFFAFSEGVEWTDALYLSTVTMTTVGYGDLAPTTDASKAFAIGYILLGLSLVATCIGVIIGGLQGTMDAAASTGVSKRHKYLYQALRSAATVVVLLAIGATFMAFAEDWPMLDALYWAVVTASSVGYGDLVPTSAGSRLFVSVYVLIACGGLAVSMSNFGSIIMAMEADHKAKQFVQRGVTEAMIREMDSDGSGGISRAEFLEYMLVAMGKLEQEDLDQVNFMFAQLDADGSGELDVEDVRAFQRNRRSSREGAASVAASAEAGMARGPGARALQKPLLGALHDGARRA